jgi:hypothetical protein
LGNAALVTTFEKRSAEIDHAGDLDGGCNAWLAISGATAIEAAPIDMWSGRRARDHVGRCD